MQDLAARIQRLEDIEAIRQLKAEYCEICDDDHNPDRIVTIFTQDGVWEGRGIGKAEGHAAIRKLFLQFQSMMSFTQHMTMNPRITVDGDTAQGSWYFFGPFTFYEGNQAKWQAARYQETYRRENGVWKIAHLLIKSPTMIADYEKGWASKTRNKKPTVPS